MTLKLQKMAQNLTTQNDQKMRYKITILEPALHIQD